MRIVKKIIQYLMSLAIGLLLLWYTYRDLHIDAIILKLKSVAFEWVILSVVLGIVSHVIRAYRWNLLLQPMGFYPTIFSTFLAVMSGYFANLLIPRMGEVTRCVVLKKTNRIPMSNALGTVIAERLIDLLSLMVLTIVTFFMAFGKLKNIFWHGFLKKIANFEISHLATVLIVLSVVLVGMLFFFLIKKKYDFKQHLVLLKIRNFLKDFLQGFGSIKNVKSPKKFWLLTILLWLSYFWVGYLVVFAVQETAGLGFTAGLVILIMGSIGMAAPVQSGIGTYHWLVSSTLVAYGVAKEAGIVYATLTHSAHMVTIIVLGGISLVVSMWFRIPQHCKSA